jgi:predicted NBD/HSP70 family sugar kinase
MYVGVDIGGTKTLVAVLDKRGVIVEHNKFPTPHDYGEFLENLTKVIAAFKIKDFAAGGVGIPGPSFDREHGIGVRLGNLPWRNVPILQDAEDICHCPIAVENDAKLAALSEAMLLKDTYKKVLYVTVSTGIGIALVVDGVIDTSIGDGGGRTILLEHDGKIMPWEDFASGRAIVERYGKRASEITDEATWKAICRDLAKGFIHLIALMQPEVIVIGGGVGTYFNRYGKILQAEIENYNIPLIQLPVLVEAQRPEEAVVYGCYDLAKQTFPHAKAHK